MLWLSGKRLKTDPGSEHQRLRSALLSTLCWLGIPLLTKNSSLIAHVLSEWAKYSWMLTQLNEYFQYAGSIILISNPHIGMFWLTYTAWSTLEKWTWTIWVSNPVSGFWYFSTGRLGEQGIGWGGFENRIGCSSNFSVWVNAVLRFLWTDLLLCWILSDTSGLLWALLDTSWGVFSLESSWDGLLALKL